jgi:steroid 5-alpha reductase family enzyme
MVVMEDSAGKSLLTVLVVAILGIGLGIAGSQSGVAVGGLPVFGLAVAAAFVIQWLVFVPSFLLRTERFFDLTGSFTYLAITLVVVFLSPGADVRSWVLAAMVAVWALRLGTFLFRRVERAGKDSRFDQLKQSAPRFLVVWTIQGLWVSVTASAAWIAITSQTRVPLDGWAVAGVLLWLIGFGSEAVADAQKSRFKADPANAGQFIRTGLWSRSRHPNYFGEIVLWIGVLVVTVPVLQGWGWVALISPVFVALLLLRVSGIPLLETKADATWGGQPDYEAYKKSTPILVPKLT